MYEPKTMTLHELAGACRANLISVSEATLGDMIVAGKLPNMYGSRQKENVCIITRHAARAWLRDMLGEEPCGF